MAVAQFSLAGRIQGQPGGSLNLGPITFGSANANYTIRSVSLNAGSNTINVPNEPPTSGVIVILPKDNVQPVTIKGQAGDTGITIGKTGWVVLTWDPANPPNNFVLQSAGSHLNKDTAILFF